MPIFAPANKDRHRQMNIPYYPGEYRALLRLGLPITIAQVGLTLQGMVDVLMVGKHSAEELAAVGFVNALLLMALLLSMGYAQAGIPQIGALYTQGKTREIVSVLKSSVAANIMQGAFVCLLMLGIWAALPYLPLDQTLLPLMRSYYLILLPSLLIFSAGHGFKAFFDSINDTRTSMWMLLAGNVLNIIFNWMFIYGNCGFAEMGSDGAAWATFASRVFIVIGLLANFFVKERYRPYREHWKDTKVEREKMKRQNSLGWPIAIQMTIETAAFSGVALLLGMGGVSWDATSALSAHQIMTQMACFIYMFYIGIGSAVSIRVSNYHGLNDRNGARKAAGAGYEMILLVGIVCSAIAFAVRNDVASLFLSTEDAEMTARVSEIVAAMAWPMMAYQLGDGLQTNFVNALRGYGDVKVLMKYSFLAYIVISIPLSYIFGVVMDYGACGIWWGFPFGLTVAAILYLIRFRKITSKS